MTKKTHKQKDGTIWEWEENASTVEYIKQMQENDVGNTQGRSQNTSQESKKS